MVHCSQFYSPPVRQLNTLPSCAMATRRTLGQVELRLPHFNMPPPVVYKPLGRQEQWPPPIHSVYEHSEEWAEQRLCSFATSAAHSQYSKSLQSRCRKAHILSTHPQTCSRKKTHSQLIFLMPTVFNSVPLNYKATRPCSWKKTMPLFPGNVSDTL